MNRKLTLTIEKEVIQIAKKYAAEKGHSLSELVENYFKLLTTHRSRLKKEELMPTTKKLKGILKVNEDFDYKKILTEELSKKYGL